MKKLLVFFALAICLTTSSFSQSSAVGTPPTKGSAFIVSGQVTTSTAASTAIAARATRRTVTFKNIDPTIAVYVGPATVTALNGMELKAGESITLDTVKLIQVIAASGTPKIAYIETYD